MRYKWADVSVAATAFRQELRLDTATKQKASDKK